MRMLSGLTKSSESPSRASILGRLMPGCNDFDFFGFILLHTEGAKGLTFRRGPEDT